MTADIINTKLESPTGATLNLYSLEAQGTPRGVVQINHGLAEHAERYGRFMQALAQAGFHSCAHDHRGHGATTASDAPLGRFAGQDGAAKVIADVKAVHDHIAGVHPGLPVIAFGQDAFPAFWSARSPLKAPLRMDDAAAIARAHAARRSLGIPGGQLVANPIPAEAEIPAETLAPIIAQAQADAARHRITGKAVTPYLLQRIYEGTGGRSLTANIALVRNNARLAARIARELLDLQG